MDDVSKFDQGVNISDYIPSNLILRVFCVTSRTSGVGTVAAVAAMAATLFRPYINIHNRQVSSS